MYQPTVVYTTKLTLTFYQIRKQCHRRLGVGVCRICVREANVQANKHRALPTVEGLGTYSWKSAHNVNDVLVCDESHTLCLPI